MNKSHPIESNYRPSHERGGCSTTELRWRGFKSQVENIALRLIHCKPDIHHLWAIVLWTIVAAIVRTMCTPHLLGRHSSCARYASMVSLIDSEAKGSMRDFVLVKLTDEEFDDFSARHPQGNFQQTSAMGRLRAAQGMTSNIWPSRRARRSSRRHCSKLTALDSLHLRSSMMARCATITTPKH